MWITIGYLKKNLKVAGISMNSCQNYHWNYHFASTSHQAVKAAKAKMAKVWVEYVPLLQENLKLERCGEEGISGLENSWSYPPWN